MHEKERDGVADYADSETASENGMNVTEETEEDRRAELVWQRNSQLRRAVKVSVLIDESIFFFFRLHNKMYRVCLPQLEPDDSMVDIKPIIRHISVTPLSVAPSDAGDDSDDDDELFHGLNPSF